uniref:Uncharacterized protein n=1 Tax=Magallana gigas TaxID=29159 RepID=A0A8W8HRR6_MAGGI
MRRGQQRSREISYKGNKSRREDVRGGKSWEVCRRDTVLPNRYTERPSGETGDIVQNKQSVRCASFFYPLESFSSCSQTDVKKAGLKR